MKTKQTAPKDIDEYIAGFPGDVQEILEKILIRKIVKFRVKEVSESAEAKVKKK